jgi:hypothetical protein
LQQLSFDGSRASEKAIEFGQQRPFVALRSRDLGGILAEFLAVERIGDFAVELRSTFCKVTELLLERDFLDPHPVHPGGAALHAPPLDMSDIVSLIAITVTGDFAAPMQPAEERP